MRIRFSWLIILISFYLFSCASGKKARTRRTEKVIQTARSYTGTPYKYGGTSRSGIDCSGLLVMSFRAADLTLPRTAKEQSKTGKSVNKNELKKGDLVFFSAKPRKRKITHAGMVTEVRSKDNVRFIHSSSSLGVVEVNLFSDYYQKIFVKARRPKY